MINKIEKLLDLCIKIAEKQLDKMEGAPIQPVLPMAAAPITSDGPDQMVEVPAEPAKKTRKPRTAKVIGAPVDEAIGASESAADLEDQLGVEESKAPEMTEEESKAKMEEVTKQFVSLCKNDKPEDGKTVAIRLMRETFKVQKLGELSHKQRIEWIKEMEKGILAHK